MFFFGRLSKKRNTRPTPKSSTKPAVSTITIDGIGSVEINHSLRARRLSLAVRHNGTIRLTVPRFMEVSQALEFVETKRQWLLQTLDKIARQSSDAQADKPIIPPYTTRCRTLELQAAECDQISIHIDHSRVLVCHPCGLHIEDKGLQQAIRQAIDKAYSLEARELLAQRLEQVAKQCRIKAPQYSWSYSKVTIRKARTRWGSCSVQNNISLNEALIRLPDHLLDYVLAHELTHTVHKNHRREFHSLLNSVLDGDEKELRKELHSYRNLLR